MAESPPNFLRRPDPTQTSIRPTILSVSRKTRLLIERNEILALSGFRVVSPGTAEEATLLAVQQKVDAVVIGHSLDRTKRTSIIEAIRRSCPNCLIVFVYARPDGCDEPLADAEVDITDGPEPLVKELRDRLSVLRAAPLPVLREFLQASIEASAADFGNIQLFNPSAKTLTITVQHGFSRDFLRFFAVVHGTDTACGSALKSGSRVVVEDVATDDIFRNKVSGEQMLRANSRAVQSTPLIGASGNLLGVASTHYRQPGAFSASRLAALDRVTQKYVTILDHYLPFSPP